MTGSVIKLCAQKYTLLQKLKKREKSSKSRVKPTFAQQCFGVSVNLTERRNKILCRKARTQAQSNFFLIDSNAYVVGNTYASRIKT